MDLINRIDRASYTGQFSVEKDCPRMKVDGHVVESGVSEAPSGVFGDSGLFSHSSLIKREVGQRVTKEKTEVKLYEIRQEITSDAARSLHGIEAELKGPISKKRLEWLMKSVSGAELPQAYKAQLLERMNEHYPAG